MAVFTGQAVSLEHILALREARATTMQVLLDKHSGATVVCLKLNIPGALKRSQVLDQVFHTGVTAWEALAEAQGMSLTRAGVAYEPAGTTYYGVVAPTIPSLAVKQALITLENSHPLGRLFDFDTTPALSRTVLGYPSRGCLLCDQPAVLCTRAQTHSMAELQAWIITLISAHLPIH